MRRKAKIRVLWFRVDEPPVEVLIDDTLEEMQRLVGGMIERVRLAADIDLWCNENGIAEQLPLQLARVYVGGRGRGGRAISIFGDFFIVRNRQTSDGEVMASLTDADVEEFNHAAP